MAAVINNSYNLKKIAHKCVLCVCVCVCVCSERPVWWRMKRKQWMLVMQMT